jgi:hypothetical protein
VDKQTLARLRTERRLLERAIAAIELYRQVRREPESDAGAPRLQIVWKAPASGTEG